MPRDRLPSGESTDAHRVAATKHRLDPGRDDERLARRLYRPCASKAFFSASRAFSFSCRALLNSS